MQTYAGMNGNKYILGNVVGSGGEGTAYYISGRNDVVGKICFNKIFKTNAERQTMERKLKTMIGLNIQIKVDNILRLAWPIEKDRKTAKRFNRVSYKNGGGGGICLCHGILIGNDLKGGLVCLPRYLSQECRISEIQ